MPNQTKGQKHETKSRVWAQWRAKVWYVSAWLSEQVLCVSVSKWKIMGAWEECVRIVGLRAGHDEEVGLDWKMVMDSDGWREVVSVLWLPFQLYWLSRFHASDNFVFTHSFIVRWHYPVDRGCNVLCVCALCPGVNHFPELPGDGAREHPVSEWGNPVLLSPRLHHHTQVLDQRHQDPLRRGETTLTYLGFYVGQKCNDNDLSIVSV